jgi:hypothetical protein
MSAPGAASGNMNRNTDLCNRLTPGANHAISPNVARVPTCNTSQGRLERGCSLCFEIPIGRREQRAPSPVRRNTVRKRLWAAAGRYPYEAAMSTGELLFWLVALTIYVSVRLWAGDLWE